MSSGSSGEDCGWVDAVEWTPASPSALLKDGLDTDLDITTGGDSDGWYRLALGGYDNGDCTHSGYCDNDEKSQMDTVVSGSGTVSFYWKVDSEADSDYLEFYIDGVRQDQISGDEGWAYTSYEINDSGPHYLLWQYSKDGSGDSGSDCGWVDYLQWTGSSGSSGSSGGQEITYTYDPSGRRIAKDVDGVVTKYLYDGDNCIAEYDANDTLLRTFVHGPCIDEPICMIETTGSYADTYYYHYDALGSVVALSDSDGDTVQVYEYDVYGQVAASDANHPNPFLFTGRRYDTETGLYYYRARYYNPSIGRFLQTDPIGYGDGMNWYAYCTNNAVSRSDSTGLGMYRFWSYGDGKLSLIWDNGSAGREVVDTWESIDAFLEAADSGDIEEIGDGWIEDQAAWGLAAFGEGHSQAWWAWRLQAIAFLDTGWDSGLRSLLDRIKNHGYRLKMIDTSRGNKYFANSNKLWWRSEVSLVNKNLGNTPKWNYVHPLAMLAHELTHARDDSLGRAFPKSPDDQKTKEDRERTAVRSENLVRKFLHNYDPDLRNKLWPRPGYMSSVGDVEGADATEAWANFDPDSFQWGSEEDQQ